MKSIKLIEKIKEKKELSLLLATFLLTLGVYVSFPERGLVATFPVLFVFAFVAGLFCPKPMILFFIGGGIGLLYGVMGNLPSSVFFGLFCALGSMCGGLCVKALQRVTPKKKVKGAVSFFLPLLAGLILPMLFAGTPMAYLRERDRAFSYLETNYPDQTFSQVVFYYDLSARDYRATVSYDNEGNTLTSDLLFGSTVQDGYRKAYADYVLIKQKTELISVFQENNISVTTDETGLLAERDEPLPGSYGSVSEKLLPKMHFTVTFRDEKPERRDFADACSEALEALQKSDVRFGKITFLGLDAGNTVYRCEVTFDTDPQETLSLVVRA